MLACVRAYVRAHLHTFCMALFIVGDIKVLYMNVLVVDSI